MVTRSSGRRVSGAVLLVAASLAAAPSGPALAQSLGSTHEAAPIPAQPPREPRAPAPAPRRPAPAPKRSAAIPRRPAPPPAERPPAPSFDGAWAVSAGGGCASAGTSQVTILGGRVIGQGVTGRVGPFGDVSTLGTFDGLTVAGRGKISGGTAYGSYRQSDGCVGPWSAVRL